MVLFLSLASVVFLYLGPCCYSAVGSVQWGEECWEWETSSQGNLALERMDEPLPGRLMAAAADIADIFVFLSSFPL